MCHLFVTASWLLAEEEEEEEVEEGNQQQSKQITIETSKAITKHYNIITKHQQNIKNQQKMSTPGLLCCVTMMVLCYSSTNPPTVVGVSLAGTWFKLSLTCPECVNPHHQRQMARMRRRRRMEMRMRMLEEMKEMRLEEMKKVFSRGRLRPHVG